jgi:hypothetical protein
MGTIHLDGRPTKANPSGIEPSLMDVFFRDSPACLDFTRFIDSRLWRNHRGRPSDWFSGICCLKHDDRFTACRVRRVCYVLFVCRSGSSTREIYDSPVLPHQRARSFPNVQNRFAVRSTGLQGSMKNGRPPAPISLTGRPASLIRGMFKRKLEQKSGTFRRWPTF